VSETWLLIPRRVRAKKNFEQETVEKLEDEPMKNVEFLLSGSEL